MDNFLSSLSDIGNNILQTTNRVVGNQIQQFTQPTRATIEGVKSLADEFANWQKTSPVAQSIGLGFQPFSSPIQQALSQTPEYISQGVEGINSHITGQGFLPNAARDTVGVLGGIASLPGIVAQVGQDPRQIALVGSSLVGGIADNYRRTAGFDDQGQWSAQNIGENFYNRPVSTLLDVLPFVGLFGKLGKTGKAGDAVALTPEEVPAALGRTTSPIRNITEEITGIRQPQALDDYMSPQRARQAQQPSNTVLDELLSIEDQLAEKRQGAGVRLNQLMNYGTELLSRGYSKKQVDNVGVNMARELIDQNISPRDLESFRKTWKPTQEYDPLDIRGIVEESPVKNKLNIFDKFATPEYVLEKLGAGNEMRQLRQAYDAYLDELPVEINRITEWSKRVPKSEHTDLYRYLDGRETTGTLSQSTMQVAQEIKSYMGAWADRLRLPQDQRITNYINHIFEKGEVDKDPDFAGLLTDRKVASSTWDPFLTKRKGKFVGLIEDPFRSLDAYVKRATRKVNIDPALQNFSQKAENLDDLEYKYVKRYIDHVQMRPSELDLLIDNAIKDSSLGYKAGSRPTNVISRGWRQLIFRGLLGGNLSSALTNLMQGTNTLSKLGEPYTVLGYSRVVQQLPRLMAGKQTELDRVGVLRDNFVQDRVMSATRKGWENLDKGLFYLFDLTDKISRGAAYFGAKAKYLKQGKTEGEAIEKAKAIVRETQFDYSRLSTPEVLQGDIPSLLGQFQSYPVKQAEFLTRMAKNKEYVGLARYVGYNLALIAGIAHIWGQDWTSPIPFASNIQALATGGKEGRYPSPPFVQPLVGLGEAALVSHDKYGGKLSLGNRLTNNNLVSGIMNHLPAGAQLKKTGKNFLENMAGGSYTESGRLRYPADPSLQGYLFGANNNPNAQEYYDQGYNSLSPTETQQYNDMTSVGVSPQEAYDAFRAKEAEEKAFQDSLKPKDGGFLSKLLTGFGLFGKKEETTGTPKTSAITGDPILDAVNKEKNVDELTKRIKQIYESGLTPEQISQVLAQNGMSEEQAKEIMLGSLTVENKAPILHDMIAKAGSLWLPVFGELARKELLTTEITKEWLEKGIIDKNQKKVFDAEINNAKNPNDQKNPFAGLSNTYTPRISAPSLPSHTLQQVDMPQIQQAPNLPTEPAPIKPISATTLKKYRNINFGKEQNTNLSPNQNTSSDPTKYASYLDGLGSVKIGQNPTNALLGGGL